MKLFVLIFSIAVLVVTVGCGEQTVPVTQTTTTTQPQTVLVDPRIVADPNYVAGINDGYYPLPSDLGTWVKSVEIQKISPTICVLSLKDNESTQYDLLINVISGPTNQWYRWLRVHAKTGVQPEALEAQRQLYQSSIKFPSTS